jgi:hypothetical protein
MHYGNTSQVETWKKKISLRCQTIHSGKHSLGNVLSVAPILKHCRHITNNLCELLDIL